MPLYNLRAVKNGYVFQLTEYGDEYVATNLKDVALAAGEIFPGNDYVHYRTDTGNQMPQVIHLAKSGQKIEAIKTLRSQYSGTLGLREAKDLVEAIADGYRTKISDDF